MGIVLAVLGSPGHLLLLLQDEDELLSGQRCQVDILGQARHDLVQVVLRRHTILMLLLLLVELLLLSQHMVLLLGELRALALCDLVLLLLSSRSCVCELLLLLLEALADLLRLLRIESSSSSSQLAQVGSARALAEVVVGAGSSTLEAEEGRVGSLGATSCLDDLVDVRELVHVIVLISTYRQVGYTSLQLHLE